MLCFAFLIVILCFGQTHFALLSYRIIVYGNNGYQRLYKGSGSDSGATLAGAENKEKSVLR